MEGPPCLTGGLHPLAHPPTCLPRICGPRIQGQAQGQGGDPPPPTGQPRMEVGVDEHVRGWSRRGPLQRRLRPGT